MPAAQPLPHGGEEAVAGVVVGGAGIRIEPRRPGQAVAVIAAVGGVQIDEDVRVPGVEQRVRRPGLGRFQLHVVAVEVEALTVEAGPHDGRPVLARPVPLPRAQALVPVGIVDRHHQDDDAVEQRRQRTDGEIAQQLLRRFLALDLAAVNVALDVDHRLPGAGRGQRTLHHRPRREHPRQPAALRALAQGADAEVGGAAGQGVEKAQHVGVGRGLGAAAALGAGGLGGQARPRATRRAGRGAAGERIDAGTCGRAPPAMSDLAHEAPSGPVSC